MATLNSLSIESLSFLTDQQVLKPDRDQNPIPQPYWDKFSVVELIPPISTDLKIPTILGNGALIKYAHDGGDVEKVFNFYTEQVKKHPHDGGLLLDLALVHLIKQQKEEAYRIQAEALKHHQLFRVVGTKGEEVETRRRILALVAPGDFMNNAQLEFILNGSDIGLDVLYILPGHPLPEALPEHDVAFCAVNESDENIPILKRLCQILPRWPRPVLNSPEKIKDLSRDRLSVLLAGHEKICMPTVSRVDLSDLLKLSLNDHPLETLLPGASYPILVRPVGSHCGKNLDKLEGPQDLEKYMSGLDEEQDDFYLASFLDYKSSDGLYRKYRVVLIDGKPYICHMAISEQWKIHYVNAGMASNPSKRAQEAQAMDTFEQDFALRHKSSFDYIHSQIGLNYLGIDCSELPDGRFLIFEAETAMVIHTMDDPTVYPYKQAQMKKVFDAVFEMIDRAAADLPFIKM